MALTDGAEPERFAGRGDHLGLFPILGVPPMLGRHFNADDDRPGAEPVVMLSHEVWQRRYQGDPSIVGRSVSVNGKPHTVVGVMPTEVQLSREPEGLDPARPDRDERIRGPLATCSRSGA